MRLARADSNDAPVVAVGLGGAVTAVVAVVDTAGAVTVADVTVAFVVSGGDVEFVEVDGSRVEIVVA